MRRSSKEREQRMVDTWNSSYEVGQSVRYWTMLREGEGKSGDTRSKAHLSASDHAVVWVTGLSGYVALSHVEAM